MIIHRLTDSQHAILRRLLSGIFVGISLVFAIYSPISNSFIQSQTNTVTSPSSLVVVVNKNNPISSLEKKEVIDIYMGRFKTFPNGMIASPLDLPDGTEHKQLFYHLLVDKSERNIKAYWSRLLFSGRATPPTQVDSARDAIEIINTETKSMAYLYANEVTPEMKIVYEF